MLVAGIVFVAVGSFVLTVAVVGSRLRINDPLTPPDDVVDRVMWNFRRDRIRQGRWFGVMTLALGLGCLVAWAFERA